jgi:hypothetical protein
MKRRHAIVIGLVGLAVAAIVFWPRPPRPCLATFQRVQAGMTRDEVYKTVGRTARRLYRRHSGHHRRYKSRVLGVQRCHDVRLV